MRRIPLWLKIAWTVWVLVWAPIYQDAWGWSTFLWFCDIGNVMIAAALWLESPLIFAWQASSVLLVQVLWVLDLAGRLVIGKHLIGGTEYMFSVDYPLHVRLLSLFHVAAPPVLLWAIWKLGYDRRGWIAQAATSTVVLPLSFLLTPPALDINWVYGPWGTNQTWMPPVAYLLLTMLAYPIVMYLPTHLALSLVFKKKPDAK